MANTRPKGQSRLDQTEPEVTLPVTLPSTLPSAQSATPKHSSVWRILLPATAVVFILGAGNQLSLAPATAILEKLICDKYYGTSSATAAFLGSVAPTAQLTILDDVDRCKAEPIQSEISFILGWRDVFENLPAILLAMPYGVLSDRIGRRKVMILATIGVVLNDTWIRLVYWFPNLPIRLVWLSGIWQMIGAGAPTLTSIVYAQVADVCPVEQRPVAFSFIQAALLVPQIVFLPIGSAFMSINPWIPMIATTVLGVTAILIACLILPETSPAVAESSGQDGEREPLLNRENGNAPAKSDVRSRVLEAAKSVKAIYHRASSNLAVTCVLISLFVFNFGLQADGVLLLLYASKRLRWTLDAASLLLSLRTIVTLTLLSVVLPALSRFILAWLKIPEKAKNKLLTQVCGLFLAIGAAIIFLANSWVAMIVGQLVFSAGSVFLVPARSLLAGLTEQKHTGALFTLSAVMLHGGFLAAAPTMAATFKWGMKLGDFWMGMPFLISFGCFLTGTMLLSLIVVKDGEPVEDDDESVTVIGEESI
ncbi:putative Major facilitator superfamily (MFS) profile domain-containing protein [Seiridium unicorne]|uniref:Major facilitator superfamily (MFS) profile domain-containing protein n=1 Tax=Seiridium unicorne TaxID=138068 RepID=A0ABR2UWM0_9PEZI